MSRPASGGNPYLNLGVLALVVAVLCLLPMMTTPYYIRVATGVAMWAGLALSWNVICGYAGYISFGHVAFFGIGAYTTAILMQPDHDWNFWATLPVAAVIAGAVAALVGWPALRLKGAYFAIATWALAEAVRELTTVLDFTGGSRGLTTPIRLDDNFFYYTMLAASAIAYAVCYLLLERSRFGFRVKAVRDNEVAARAQGINTTLVKIEAFVLSAIIPAVLGGINAYWITFINPDSVLNTIITDQLVVMVLVGGLGHAWGPALGATALYLLAGAAPGQLRRDDRIHHHRRRAGDGGRAVSSRRAGQPRPASTTDAAGTPATRPRPRRRRAPANGQRDRGGQTMTVLAVDELSRSFGGIHAVDGVTFDVEQAEIVGIIGPNGSGKSTLFNLLTGALKPDAGTITLFDRNITRLAAYRIARAGLGRTFQIPALFVNMTVRENLWTAAVQFDWNNARADADAVLERLELTHVADDLASTLSGGQQRLLEMGRVLMQNPKVALLDEVAAGVHPRLRQIMLDAIRTLRDAGTTFLVIEHDMELAQDICDRIIVMDAGKIVAQGSFEEISHDPHVMEAYLGVSAE